MAENRQTIVHFVKRAAKDLEHLKSEAERIGGDELSRLVELLGMALLEARERGTSKS